MIEVAPTPYDITAVPEIYWSPSATQVTLILLLLLALILMLAKLFYRSKRKVPKHSETTNSLQESLHTLETSPSEHNTEIFLRAVRRAIAYRVGRKAYSLTASELLKLAYDRKDEKLQLIAASLIPLESATFSDQFRSSIVSEAQAIVHNLADYKS